MPKVVASIPHADGSRHVIEENDDGGHTVYLNLPDQTTVEAGTWGSTMPLEALIDRFSRADDPMPDDVPSDEIGDDSDDRGQDDVDPMDRGDDDVPGGDAGDYDDGGQDDGPDQGDNVDPPEERGPELGPVGDNDDDRGGDWGRKSDGPTK